MASGWTIVEGDDFPRAVAQLGNFEEIDAILGAISYGLHRNPMGFPATQFPRIFLAKTKLRFWPTLVPSYRVWFRADREVTTVTLLWMDIAPPEDMGLAHTFNDPDDLTF